MKRYKLSKSVVSVVFVLISIVSALIVNITGPKEPRTVIVAGDGCGHFDYLPAWFVYGTVDFQPVFEKEKERHDMSYMGHYFHTLQNSVVINKYTCGTAVMILPFYLTALLLSPFLGFPADGFGLLFQYAVVLAGMFWLLIGLRFFLKLLQSYGVPLIRAFLYSLLLLFGTNLFYYAFIGPAFSHVYSFALISILLYQTHAFFVQPRPSRVYSAAFVYGLIVLVRPVNAIVLPALPFMASSWKQFRNGFGYLLHPARIVLSVLAVLVALSPQIIINFLQTGTLWINGYINEGFYFLHPRMLDFLFSFRKGWFVYTPLMLFIIPAAILLFRRNRYGFWVLTTFFLMQVYLFSSWWNWFYGDSFGMRPMVDYYALYFLPVVFLFEAIKNRTVQMVTAVTVLFFVFLNLFQTYQYAEGIIHPDAMNRKAWSYLFLKGADKYKNVVGDCNESFYGTLTGKPILLTKYTRDGTAHGWSDAKISVNDPAGTANEVAVVNRKYRFSPTYVQHVADSLLNKSNLYVYFKSDYWEPLPNEARYARFVVHVVDKTGANNLFYKAFSFKRLPDGVVKQWRHAEIGFKLPVIKEKGAVIKYYIWYRGDHLLYLDNLSLEMDTYN